VLCRVAPISSAIAMNRLGHHLEQNGIGSVAACRRADRDVVRVRISARAELISARQPGSTTIV